MNAKHTPGPWNIGTSDIPVSSFSVHGGNRNHSTIARLASLDFVGMGLDEQYANARLIAAAPELLVALEQMLNLNSLGAYEQSAAISAARAAIAKARGEA